MLTPLQWPGIKAYVTLEFQRGAAALNLPTPEPVFGEYRENGAQQPALLVLLHSSKLERICPREKLVRPLTSTEPA